MAGAFKERRRRRIGAEDCLSISEFRRHPEAAKLVQLYVPAGLRSADALAAVKKRCLLFVRLHFVKRNGGGVVLHRHSG